MTNWSNYLEEFHGQKSGITEQLLDKCTTADGQRPYRWLTSQMATEQSALTVDLACGNGPAAAHFPSWIGLDISVGELTSARERGRGPLVRASATAVPLPAECAAGVLAMMSLMVVDDPAAAIAEAARICRPGGRFGILLPAQWPLRIRDVARYGVLLAALGQRSTPFPHRELSSELADLLGSAGFRIAIDESVRFGFEMKSTDDADLLVDALYLPGVSDRRLAVAKQFARRWGHANMGLALRRVVAVRLPSGGS